MTISSLSELGRYLRADAASRRVGSHARSFLLDPVYRFTVYLRLNEYLLNAGVPLIFRTVPWLLFRRLSVRLGFSVPPNVFGPGLAIIHYGLLVVNPDARVGANCRVHAGVNIGGAAGFYDIDEAVRLAPVIGDNCYIGPGAKIFGPVRIGNDCAIGANAVVNHSFPDSSVTIAGIPAKIVATKGSDGLVAPNPYV
jgi:serine O-acetyltransferase